MDSIMPGRKAFHQTGGRATLRHRVGRCPFRADYRPEPTDGLPGGDVVYTAPGR